MSWPARSRIARVSSSSSRSETSRATLREPATRAGQALAQLGRRGAQQPLVLLVGHLVDAPPQRLAALALVQLAQQAAVLDRDRVPAGRLEHVADPPGGDVGDDPVERLPVEVDDPEHLAQVRDDRVHDRLPAGALVELGVADQGDGAAAARNLEVAGDVAVRERAPDRRGGTDAHGARGEVRRHRVLQPARVRLQPAERAQLGQVAAVEVAQQVLDRVQHGRRVRLDRDAVRTAQVLEPERGHDRHHRGRRGLMAAHLHPRGRLRANPVGVVDDARREPQDASLDRLQRRDVRRVRAQRDAGLLHSVSLAPATLCSGRWSARRTCQAGRTDPETPRRGSSPDRRGRAPTAPAPAPGERVRSRSRCGSARRSGAHRSRNTGARRRSASLTVRARRSYARRSARAHQGSSGRDRRGINSHAPPPIRGAAGRRRAASPGAPRSGSRGVPGAGGPRRCDRPPRRRPDAGRGPRTACR